MHRHQGKTLRRALPKAIGRSALVLVLLSGAAGAEAAGRVELISRADPLPDTDGYSLSPSISADGRYVAFLSDAPNLAPGQVDRNSDFDVFLRDQAAGTTTLVSHLPGSPATAPGRSPLTLMGTQISADGRFVVYFNSANGLVPGDANFRSDVFLYDRAAGTTTLVSHASGDPGAPGDNNSRDARISADGSAVVFVSTASNLVAGQNGPSQVDNVFLWQRATGSITLVSRRAGTSSSLGDGFSQGAEISADGRFVVFISLATNLVPGQIDVNASADVFVFDSSSGAVSLVSHASGSPLQVANTGGRRPHISADGRWIAFFSDARNLVPGQIDNTATDVFLYDRVSGETRLASHIASSPVTAGGIAPGTLLSMSADGRYLAFASGAPNLVAGQVDTNGRPDVFVYDRVTGTTELVSHTPKSRTTATTNPVAANSPAISADGRYVAFQSGAVDLVARQTDRRYDNDVFLHDRVFQTTVLASHTSRSNTTAAGGETPVISRNGSVVAFVSFSRDLAQGQVDPNGFLDLFLYKRATADVTLLSRRDPGLPVVTPHGESLAHGISADGRFVLFSSYGNGLVPGQTEPFAAASQDVFLRDRATGKTLLLSHATSSPLTAIGGDLPVLSADGRSAAFRVISRGRQGAFPTYVYDRTRDALALINHLPGSLAESDGYVLDPVFSTDGRYLAFTCVNCSLVPGQRSGQHGPGGTTDVFLHDRVTRNNTLVSHASGSPATTGDEDSSQPRISADGRFVLFTSQATNLVAGQNSFPGREQVFVFDRVTGANTLVSHSAASATTGSNDDAQGTAISANGRWILFWSNTSDVVAGQVDDNNAFDLFLFDRVSGRTSLVSRATSSPVVTANGDTGSSASMSANGRWIAFESLATDLAAGPPGVTDTNNAYDVFLFDRFTGATELVSSGAGPPLRAANQESRSPRISADGSRIAFLSSATDLAPGQPATGGAVNLVVYERTTGARTVVGRVRGPEPLDSFNSISFIPWLSANGRQVAFTSDANNLAAGDRNENWDAYLFDAETERVP